MSPSALTDQEDLKRKQSNITNIPESKKKPRQHLLDWNIKLIRARFSCFFFNQHFKVGQRVQLLNRPVMTTGTIAFAGKIGMKEDNKKQTEYRLGIQLDRTGKKKSFAHRENLMQHVFSWYERWFYKWQKIFYYFFESWCIC